MPITSCTPDWLKILCPPSVIPRVGMVQAPQDHRDGAAQRDAPAMNGEYAGFLLYRHDLAQRGERNHHSRHHVPDPSQLRLSPSAAGRATPSSRTVISGWMVLEQGWHIHYTNRRYGHGIVAGYVRRLQETAPSVGLWRPADPEKALAFLCCRAWASATASAKTRVCVWLAQLARGPRLSACWLPR